MCTSDYKGRSAVLQIAALMAEQSLPQTLHKISEYSRRIAPSDLALPHSRTTGCENLLVFAAGGNIEYTKLKVSIFILSFVSPFLISSCAILSAIVQL